MTSTTAAEMIRRASDLTGSAQTARVWGGTFHAVANRLLRIYGPAIGLAQDFAASEQAAGGATCAKPALSTISRAELSISRWSKDFSRIRMF